MLFLDDEYLIPVQHRKTSCKGGSEARLTLFDNTTNNRS